MSRGKKNKKGRELPPQERAALTLTRRDTSLLKARMKECEKDYDC